MSALFGFRGPLDNSSLAQMQNALSHRGQTVDIITTGDISIGYWRSDWADATCGAGLKHTADGIIGLAGFQTPGQSESPLTLDQIAHSLATQGAIPSNLCGDFVIVFLPSDGGVTLVRDSSGARTIYYGQHQNRFYFASEPKGIWNIPSWPRALNENSLAKYLTFSFVPGESTMLAGINELLAGHRLHHQPSGETQSERYFRFENVQQAPGQRIDCDSSVREFRNVFSESIEQRRKLLNSTTPCVLLSGGLDSSVVAAELTRQHDSAIRTFSIHFGDQYPNELDHAKSVAQYLGTDHEEICIQPKNFLDKLHKMIWHLDDPIGDPITMPNFEAASRLSHETNFIFNGEGGDPCFGGPKNIPMMMLHWYGTPRPPFFRENAYLASYRRAYEELDYLFTPWFKSKLDFGSLPKILTPYFECEHPVNFLDKLTSINIRLKGAHLILPKVERMFAASSIVPLSPLFSEQMVKFSFQIPSTMKLSRGVEKVVIKKAFANELPPTIINRPKSGMRVPVHFWFQGEMRKYAKKILSRGAINRAGIFDYRRVKQLLDYNIQEGSGRYGMRLWMLITFEIWRQMVIEKRGA